MFRPPRTGDGRITIAAGCSPKKILTRHGHLRRHIGPLVLVPGHAIPGPHLPKDKGHLKIHRQAHTDARRVRDSGFERSWSILSSTCPKAVLWKPVLPGVAKQTPSLNVLTHHRSSPTPMPMDFMLPVSVVVPRYAAILVSNDMQIRRARHLQRANVLPAEVAGA